jgi:hypothetical protein
MSLLVLTGAVATACGEDLRTDINPALLYYRALLMPVEPFSDADWNYLALKKGKEQKLPERFAKTLASYDNQFLLLRQAAHATVPCDWGIDLNPGPNIALPHLARAKAACQAAQLRAVWALEHGRQQDALDDLLTAFVLGRNVATDGLLISAFVQCAIEEIDYATAAQHFGEFSPATLKQLVNGFDAAPARRTMAACMASEKFLGDWTLRKILELQKAHPNDDAKVMADFRDSGLVAAMDFIGYTNFWPRVVAASGGTSEGVVKLIHEAEPLFARFAEVMALPQAEFEPRARQLLADIQKSQNPFYAEFAFVLEKWQHAGFRAREFRAEAQLAMMRAAVECKLHGESGLKSVMDPFGNGPFAFRRFMFKGVDRGFELKSAYSGANAPFVMIFVEKSGPAFQVTGPDAGKAIQ